MNERECLIWLNSIKGIGYKTIKKLIDYFGDIQKLWSVSSSEIYNVPGIQKSLAKKIIDKRNSEFFCAYMEKVKKINANCICLNDSNYPSSLKEIYDPPYVLNVIGDYKEDDKFAIAIVGSRKATPYGKNIAYKFAKELVKYGITIVSGLAVGIDTAAHKGALDGGGRTIAVLGSGVDVCYPKSNINLMKKIVSSGAVLSEYPIGTLPRPGNFPRRNRIISGLVKGVLVVEAGLKSGSLITVNHALEQGRDVFAVPGNILTNTSKGTNKLIKEGAKIVTCVEDILEEYNIQNIFFENNIDIDLNLSCKEKEVYNLIRIKQPINIELISVVLRLNINELNSIITILELKGLIEELPGKIFIAV
ncbi:DNA processing protein [Caminicella sporogenes DSM 14501]|uniref:DNA processing protein n=1 Tax=Caminicella sporogenes DSM 14501 TaxID=1121266 RepID=A0A1M6LDA3_9FIRM|nr:DNA-processing protein DprA [Caminicella sporogenes]RKD27797.1 DNA protecting protein DprA [Caminicella sporogenes]SHJ69203.1 DNA processing protein [Caminicella sporogenes DSM 14501]